MSDQSSIWYQDNADLTVLKATKSKRLLCGSVDSSTGRADLIKIYLYPGWWQKIKYAFRRSKAVKEMRLARYVSDQGIPTIVPLKIKDIRKLGVLQKSVVLSEFLSDCVNLEELLIKSRLPDKRLRRKIIEAYGRLARLVHDRGVYQDDFDPNNILYQNLPDGGFQLYFIDFERARRFGYLSPAKRIHSLAKLNRMGRRLNKTDQMRFLTAYLGPETTRLTRREWAGRIREEEKKVYSKDRRRAEKACTSVGGRIGFVHDKGYRGYYRKRHHAQECYTRNDMLDLIRIIDNTFSQSGTGRFLTDQVLDAAVRLGSREVRLQVRCFEYGGWKQGGFSSIIRENPLLAAWKLDNALLKNRTAEFLPVAALEKKIARNRFHGFLIRQI